MIRIPQADVPVIDWAQVPFGPRLVPVDSPDAPYTGRGDLLDKPHALAYIATQAGKTATMPFLVVCRDVRRLDRVFEHRPDAHR